MEKKAKILRVISSILMAIVLGLLATNLSALLLSLLKPDFFEHDPSEGGSPFPLLLGFLVVSFALGPIMMWITHRFFHQTRVVYYILLALGVPAIIIGILVGIGSYSTIQDIQSADIPGEQQEHAVLGGVMMLMFAAIGIGIALLGLVMSSSAALGLWAFKIRALTPPPLETHSISRQSHRSKVWPTPR